MANFRSINNSQKVKWDWVKGHSINKFNNAVDELARNAAENLIQSF